VNKPFGVTRDYAAFHPWESVRRYLHEVEHREFYFGRGTSWSVKSGGRLRERHQHVHAISRGIQISGEINFPRTCCYIV
jgi:hypothetical protein